MQTLNLNQELKAPSLLIYSFLNRLYLILPFSAKCVCISYGMS